MERGEHDFRRPLTLRQPKGGSHLGGPKSAGGRPCLLFFFSVRTTESREECFSGSSLQCFSLQRKASFCGPPNILLSWQNLFRGQGTTDTRVRLRIFLQFLCFYRAEKTQKALFMLPFRVSCSLRQAQRMECSLTLERQLERGKKKIEERTNADESH